MAVSFTRIGVYQADWLCDEVYVSTGFWSNSGQCDVQTGFTSELEITEPVARGETILLVAVYPNGAWGTFGDGSRVQDTQGNTWHYDATDTPRTYPGYLSSGSGQSYTKVYRCNVATPLFAGDFLRVKGAVVMEAWRVNRKLLPYDTPRTAAGYGEVDGSAIEDYGPRFPIAQAVLEFGALSFYRGHDGLGTSDGADEGYPVETVALLNGSAMLDFAQGKRTLHRVIHSGTTPGSPVAFDFLYENWHTLWAGYREIPTADVPMDARFSSRDSYSGISSSVEGGIPLYQSWRAVVYYRVIGNGLWPTNYHTPWVQYHRAHVREGAIRFSGADFATPPFNITSAATTGSEDTQPALARDPVGEQDLLLITRDEAVYEAVSMDDGRTWKEPVEVFSGGQYPRIAVNPPPIGGGERIIAAYVDGVIKGRVRYPGDAEYGAPFTFSGFTPDDDAFDLSWIPGEASRRLVLAVTVGGEVQEYESGDDGQTWALSAS